jgi:hypothetical protein
MLNSKDVKIKQIKRPFLSIQSNSYENNYWIFYFENVFLGILTNYSIFDQILGFKNYDKIK